MKLFIGDRLLNMTPEELDRLYLNEGSEGVIYKNGEEVYKIYKDNPVIDKLSLEEVNRLRKLKLKRFIVPNNPIFDEDGTFIGYSSRFLNEEKFSKIFDLDGKTFKKELRLLIDDVKNLTKNGIEIDDLHLSNIVLSDGSLHFIDMGGCKHSEDDDLERTNMFRFQYFIISSLLALPLSKKNRKKFENKFSAFESFDSFIDSIDDNESVKNFSKRVIR